MKKLLLGEVMLIYSNFSKHDTLLKSYLGIFKFFSRPINEELH